MFANTLSYNQLYTQHLWIYQYWSKKLYLDSISDILGHVLTIWTYWYFCVTLSHQNRIVGYKVGYASYAHTIANKLLIIDYNQHIHVC